MPHVGWNALATRRRSVLLQGIPDGTQVYFTHSYAAPITRDAAATTEHGVRFASVVEKGLVSGVQFHPEKSSQAGLRVLRSFVRTHQMLSKRLIACLDVRDGCVVKGVQFEDLADAGDPAALARRYNAEGIDELVILDVTATIEDRRALAETLRAVSAELFIPLTVGGGIRSEADAGGGARRRGRQGRAQQRGARRSRAADPAGRALRLAGGRRRHRRQARGRGYAVFARSGRVAAAREAVEWAGEAAARGAGEILLTSIDRDGTRAGFDCALTAAVSSAVSDPGHRVRRRRNFRTFSRGLHGGPSRRRPGRVGVPLRRARRRRVEGVPPVHGDIPVRV